MLILDKFAAVAVPFPTAVDRVEISVPVAARAVMYVVSVLPFSVENRASKVLIVMNRPTPPTSKLKLLRTVLTLIPMLR